MLGETPLSGVTPGPATEDEKKLLRKKIVRKATPEEVEAWIASCGSQISDKAKATFYAMSPENQYRVTYEGPLTECNDSTEILYARVQRFMDMESQLKKLAAANAPGCETKKQSKTDKVSDLAVAIGKALVSSEVFDEVPEEERRFAVPATNGPPCEEVTEPASRVGSRTGIGGIIEALQRKYGLNKGERARVISETKELWKLEGEKTVLKHQCNMGWKWVLQGREEPGKQDPMANTCHSGGLKQKMRTDPENKKTRTCGWSKEKELSIKARES